MYEISDIMINYGFVRVISLELQLLFRTLVTLTKVGRAYCFWYHSLFVHDSV